MTRRLSVLFTLSAVAAGSLVAEPRSQEAATPVVVTAVVTDADGRPVRGLTQSDFSVREDKRAVEITGFRAFTEVDAAATGRTIVLMLGAGSSPDRTDTVQQIARRFLSRAGQADRVSVVRFDNDRDEIAASRDESLSRVAEFRTLTAPPVYDKTHEDVLTAVEEIANELRDDRIERQAIVWIGPAAVADVVEPSLGRYTRLWPYWHEALRAAARARVSVYAVDPHGLTGRVRTSPDGLVAQTGGAIIDNTNDLESGVRRIWDELGSYYALEIAGTSATRDLHEIEVTVAQRGVTVRATRRR